MKTVVLLGAAAVAAYFWQGRNINASLTLSGEGWDRLHPDVQERARAVLNDAAAAGLSVGILEGYRTRESQQREMAEGDSWTEDADNSYHRWGLAVDFVFRDERGRWTWLPTADGKPDPRWYQLGEIIERNGLQWGGRWKRFDGPHAQYKIMTIAQLKSVYGTPERLSWTGAVA